MSHNPLLGSRISLISKKNIRYEGTLYSINEVDATVALQNVRSFGTEGREKTDTTCTFVEPQDAVHPYLLFRGCDIKDLHVHESAPESETSPPKDPAIVSSSAPPEVTKQQESETTADTTTNKEKVDAKRNNGDKKGYSEKSNPPSSKNNVKQTTQPPKNKSRDSNTNRKTRKNKSSQQMIGSGASLLNRKARGAVEGVAGPDHLHKGDFDFESNLAEFSKVNILSEENDTDDDEDSNYDQEIDPGTGSCVYQKDDFFDEISCDVLDKQNGIDNRLRGAAERSLNTETFGAVSLGTGRRGGRRNRRGRGGGRGGRGYSGRGGYDGSAPRENNRWKRSQGDDRRRGYSGDISSRQTYGDGGLGRGHQRYAQASGDR